jgi:tRNA/rRNA methyltransferase
MTIAVAIVEPQYHVNVGHIARLMKNFGLEKLYLANPRYDREEAVRYATHGKDVLVSAEVIMLKQLRKKFDILVATSAIQATSKLNILRESISPERLAQLAYDAEGKDLCIVLGRESSGLNNQELELCDLVVTIDTKTRYRTMNVAHALAILLYEISRFRPEVRDRRKKTKKSIDLASQQDIDLLLRYVDKVADAGNYDDHKKPLLDAAMKKMVAESVPTTKDVMLLVSLLRRSLLAMERSRKAYRHALP